MDLALRFDDTLGTVLAFDPGSPGAMQSAWRQLVDLIARGRVRPDSDAMATLRAMHSGIPLAIRAAGARAIEFADPPLALVQLFATDDLAVALRVLASARMGPAEWIALLPDLAPEARASLRDRPDLGPDVVRALAAFDSSDPNAAAPSESGHEATIVDERPLGIADVVRRVDALRRSQETIAPRQAQPAGHFRFETDSQGVVRWVDGISRAALIGLSFAQSAGAAASGVSRIDAIAGGAFRRRARFADARLLIAGGSDAAGDWLISAVPAFDDASGRFTGYRGSARRPRRDERAEPARDTASPADSLRQLAHELRTPTNAIAGFAEMIETEMLGPVADRYRERAATIRAQARELLDAIDDLDLAARIDSAALSLTPGRVPLRPVLAATADDLRPLAALRGSVLVIPLSDLVVSGDRRAVERLIARLLATLVSASGEGERIGVRVGQANGMIEIAMDRPRALADYPGESVLGIDDEQDDGAPLGTGFALRLARNLARELGGALIIEPESLTLHLPCSGTASMAQAHLS